VRAREFLDRWTQLIPFPRTLFSWQCLPFRAPSLGGSLKQRTLARDQRNSLLRLGCSPRPGNSKQTRALFQCFDVMRHAAVYNNGSNWPAESSTGSSSGKCRRITTHKNLDRDSGLGPVFVHVSSSPHEDHSDAEVWLLCQGPRTAPGFAAPQIFLSKLVKLLLEIELQQSLTQVWQPVETFSAIAGMAGAFVHIHDQYLWTFPRFSVSRRNAGRLDATNSQQTLQSGCCRRPLPYPRALCAWL
jgi:hypothetical protein